MLNIFIQAGQVKQEFSSELDLVTNNLEDHLTTPAGLITSEDQIPSDQVQPFEQWLLSKGSVCSSAHRGFSSQDPLYLNHSHQANNSLSADVHSMFHNPTVDFTKTSYHTPQQNLSSKGQPFLPIGDGSSQLYAEQPMPQLGKGHQGMPSEHSHNQIQNLAPRPACSQSLITSSNVHRSSIHTPVQFPEFTSSEMSPQHTLTKVASHSSSIEEALMDPDPHKRTSLKTATSNFRSSHDEESLSIKPEPEEELTFQTIGLQDITLDDGKALK